MWVFFPLWITFIASSRDSMILSGERLYVIIRLGYREAKSKPVTHQEVLKESINVII